MSILVHETAYCWNEPSCVNPESLTLEQRGSKPGWGGGGGEGEGGGEVRRRFPMCNVYETYLDDIRAFQTRICNPLREIKEQSITISQNPVPPRTPPSPPQRIKHIISRCDLPILVPDDRQCELNWSRRTSQEQPLHAP